MGKRDRRALAALNVELALASLNVLRRALAQPEVQTCTLSALSLSVSQVRMLGRMGGVVSSMDATIRLCVEDGNLAHAETVLREMEVLAAQAQHFRSDLLEGPAEVRVWNQHPVEDPAPGDLVGVRAVPSMPAAMEAVRGRDGDHVDLAGHARFLPVTVHHTSGWVAAVLPEMDPRQESWAVVSPMELSMWISSLKAPRAPVGGADA
jgi:hypothetical protein